MDCIFRVVFVEEVAFFKKCVSRGLGILEPEVLVLADIILKVSAKVRIGASDILKIVAVAEDVDS